MSRRLHPSLILAALMLSCGGEGLPEISVDIGAHNTCSGSIPYTVDGSASEIQCFIDDHIVSITGGAMVPVMLLEMSTNEPGDPVCCEVCATKQTADQACHDMCNWLACDRARDEHFELGSDLGFCEPPSCGFDFEACISNSNLHFQWIDFADDDGILYGLKADCNAHASDPARPDGLFTYLEGLDGVPNSRGATAEVTDVAEWCSDRNSASDGGEAATANAATTTLTSTGGPSPDESADGTTSGDGGTDPPEQPQQCGPWAGMRAAADPTDNYGAWSQGSQGQRSDGTSTQPVTITGGGIEYRAMRCRDDRSQECIRIDRLSVRLVDTASMLRIDLNLLEKTEPMTLSPEGWVDIPAGALRFGARYTQERNDTFVQATNTQSARARFDLTEGRVELLDLEASSESGDLWASLSLQGTLLNTQPRPEIIVSTGQAWNEVVLEASTFDAEFDPITHRWMVIGHGTWATDSVEVTLPAGRHAVVLYAEDTHGARGVAATWIEIGGSP